MQFTIIFLFQFFVRTHTASLGSQVFLNGSNCALNQFCYFNDHQALGLACFDFRSLDQLNSSSCILDPTFYGRIFELDLLFADNTVLDSGIQALVDLAVVYLTSPHYFEPATLTLINIAGIDLTFFDLLRTSQNLSITFSFTPILQLYSSELNLFNKKVNILTQDQCNNQTYQAMLANNGVNFFQAFKGLTLKNIRTNQRLCQFMFRNLSLDSIEIHNKYFQFWPPDNTTRSSLNFSIRQLSLIEMNKIELDESLLDSEVFEHLQSFNIKHASILKIQLDLFKAPRFPHLRLIEFDKLINLKGFFHDKQGVAWMKYLNYDLAPIDITNKLAEPTQEVINSCLTKLIGVYFDVEATGDFGRFYPTFIYPYLDYSFPDKDFCLFYDIPVERLVFLQIFSPRFDNFTCTLYWIFRYDYLYPYLGLYSPIQSKRPPPECNFTSLVNNCDMLTSPASTDDPYFDLFFMSQGLKEAKRILFTYVGPVFSAFGFVTNMLIIVIIGYNHKRRHELRAQQKSKKNQESILLDQPLYKFILINSIENIYYTTYYYHYFMYSETNEGLLKLNDTITQLPLITSFTLVHDIFSYFLFCFISILLDVITVIKLHQALQEKKKMLHDKSEREKCSESERRSVMMVILSSLVNMVFRAPELVSVAFYYVVTQNDGHVFKTLCMTYSSCLVFVDYADIFYILSLCFSFFFYVKFNLVFYNSYQALVESTLRVFCWYGTKAQVK